MIERAVLYARISVATEQSVSVARQLASGRKYAAARGWKVVGEYVDEGVSATYNKPAERAAWQALLATETHFEAVVVWKVDRLARRVIDFLQADEVLQARDAAIVCVDQNIDMTTGEGRAFAQMLAVFGEMEAAAMSSRRRAAREYLISIGRAAGGRQPYGWQLVRHPDGPGKVRAQDRQRIEWVRQMAERALRGDTVYAIAKWLDSAGAPLPRGSKAKRWSYTSVNAILRNPAHAGMTAHNPGFCGAERGPEVLRDNNGAVVISDDAILSLDDFERLQHVITHKEHHSAIPRARQRSTSPIIARIATCATCSARLNRYGSGRAFCLRCRLCGQTIAYVALAAYLVQRLLQDRGSLPMHRRTWMVPGDQLASRKLAEIDRQLTAVALALTHDDADAGALGKELIRLKQDRKRARSGSGKTSAQVLVDLGRTLSEVWELCSTDEQRREILVSQIKSLVIAKSTHHQGGVMDPGRISLAWHDDGRQTIAPAGTSLDAMHALTYDPIAPWMSQLDAAAYVGCPIKTIRKASENGRIARRDVGHRLPSLSRASVERFALSWQPD
ncbi:recombinase family protein [Nocardioides sp. GCM10028917]|uniref:recombinase family protein n=1 Tax=Nocardioides sp. GCM10028917 TaxID=3273408 RepID=UPI0036154B3D